MTHEDALNEILSHACPYFSDNGVNQYSIELHCVTLRITARALGNLKHEILSVEKVKHESKTTNTDTLDPPLGYSDGGWRG